MFVDSNSGDRSKYRKYPYLQGGSMTTDNCHISFFKPDRRSVETDGLVFTLTMNVQK